MEQYDHISKISNQLYFGKYPCDEVIKLLKELEINVIINLTQDIENLPKYDIDCEIINFPIVDRKTGEFQKTIELIKILSDKIQQNNKIYIHCKGGHGRSGLITGGLYAYLFNKTYDETIDALKIAHQNRKIMTDRMRYLGSPQTRLQKLQLMKLINYFIDNK
ncbi:dual specificity phosphatase [Klosneuvirus KNV1]|uniref:Dual specificity phosphatase n=1 Tax=Klosneuvirus KNV1 TaxID=1977640 RepID=A0A1V0SK21_9VIRU|nr:dual specificity phosphatase [Klosneuvirus KNV1]